MNCILLRINHATVYEDKIEFKFCNGKVVTFMTDQTEDIDLFSGTREERKCTEQYINGELAEVCEIDRIISRWSYEFKELLNAGNSRAYTHSNSPVGRLFKWGDGYKLFQIYILFRDKNGKFQNPKPFIERHNKCRYLTSNEVTLYTYASNKRFDTTFIPNYIPYPKGLVNKDNVLNEILKRD